MTLDGCWMSLLVIGSLLAIGWIVCHSAKKSKEFREPAKEVREKSHEVANETTKVQYHLRQIANAPDPVRELMTRITRNR